MHATVRLRAGRPRRNSVVGRERRAGGGCFGCCVHHHVVSESKEEIELWPMAEDPEADRERERRAVDISLDSIAERVIASGHGGNNKERRDWITHDTTVRGDCNGVSGREEKQEQHGGVIKEPGMIDCDRS